MTLLERIKQKPVHTRRAIALYIASAFTGCIIIVWIGVYLVPSFSLSDKDTNQQGIFYSFFTVTDSLFDQTDTLMRTSNVASTTDNVKEVLTTYFTLSPTSTTSATNNHRVVATSATSSTTTDLDIIQTHNSTTTFLDATDTDESAL